ncbi:MAG: JAB domain-containing protein [Chloroflexota bacterium]|nr:JAB domain-containing protein [Chloroflexota bacterium]
MANRQRNDERQLTFLAPDDAALLQLVRENLRLLAELRVGYRPVAHGEPNAYQVRSPQDVADLLAPEMEMLAQEQLRVILLDTRNRVLDVVMVYQGNVGSAVVRMAELFRDAIVANAPAVVLVHNHPSGDPSASDEDVRITKDAAQAAKLLSIDLLDHVILGQARFISLKEQGVL